MQSWFLITFPFLWWCRCYCRCLRHSCCCCSCSHSCCFFRCRTDVKARANNEGQFLLVVNELSLDVKAASFCCIELLFGYTLKSQWSHGSCKPTKSVVLLLLLMLLLLYCWYCYLKSGLIANGKTTAACSLNLNTDCKHLGL